MFYSIFEKYVAVAAAALMGGPPNCSHSITFFVNVNISKVLATFFVNAEAMKLGVPFTSPLFRQNPYKQSLFGE